MKMYNKHTTFILLVIIGFACFGCAKQDDGSSAINTATVVDAKGDEMDMLLSDDFFDDDDSVSQNLYYDPLEPVNRIFFEFNDKLYYWLLNPVSNAYSSVVPLDIRYSIGNFVNNLSAPIRLVNNLLQWKVSDAGVVFSRFLINSTIGVFGFGDPAWVEFDLEPRPEDFGQTLGFWGVGEGLYLCLPILGPSNVRDTVGFAADAYTHPMVYFVDDIWFSAGYYSVSRVNLLSLNPDVYEDLKKYSLDPYVSMRQVYLDYRRTKIKDTRSHVRSDNELSSELKK
ncbi:MAG TPA: VacJ family lipoprotein [Desulfobacterales bacterium]|nr:VacJ family lipoprotein [Desulfobacterales bacterium]